jgi:hypothetical protein
MGADPDPALGAVMNDYSFTSIVNFGVSRIFKEKVFRPTNLWIPWGIDTASSFAYDTDASGVEAAMCFHLVPNDGSLGWP